MTEEKPKEPPKPGKNTNIPVKIIDEDNLIGPTIEEIYGTKEFKGGLEDIVLSMTNPMFFGCFGVDQPKSYLFTGEPGTGKTYAVNAIANTLALTVTPGKVAVMKYDIGTMGTAYINMGSVNLQNFFDVGATILKGDTGIEHMIYFFDECDSIMNKRNNPHASKEDDKLLETLMKNLQYINDRGLNEYVFFATNFPDALDSAATRSGRVNEKLNFPMPDESMRYQLIEGYIKQMNDRIGYKAIRNYDIESLVKQSSGFNCADIQLGINGAFSTKLKKELRTKSQGIIAAYWIGQNQLEEQFKGIKTQKNPTKKRIGFQV